MESLNKQAVTASRPSTAFYCRVVKGITGAVKRLFRLQIIGTEHIPKEGAFVVCGNHISNWDPVFVAVAMQCPLFFMAKKELFSIPVLGKLIRKFNAFPVDRDSADVGAIKNAFTHLKYEEPVAIFPQGHRYAGEPPRSHPIKNGVGMMVYRTQVPVLPVSVYTKNDEVRPFRKVYITIGKPILFDEYGAGEKSPEEYQKISDYIFERICILNDLDREGRTI